MTTELRTALRRARLENGRILTLNIGNKREIRVYACTLRLIAHFAELSESDYAEATAWWVSDVGGPAFRYGQIRAKKAASLARQSKKDATHAENKLLESRPVYASGNDKLLF